MCVCMGAHISMCIFIHVCVWYGHVRTYVDVCVWKRLCECLCTCMYVCCVRECLYDRVLVCVCVRTWVHTRTRLRHRGGVCTNLHAGELVKWVYPVCTSVSACVFCVCCMLWACSHGCLSMSSIRVCIQKELENRLYDSSIVQVLSIHPRFHFKFKAMVRGHSRIDLPIKDFSYIFHAFMDIQFFYRISSTTGRGIRNKNLPKSSRTIKYIRV